MGGSTANYAGSIEGMRRFWLTMICELFHGASWTVVGRISYSQHMARCRQCGREFLLPP